MDISKKKQRENIYDDVLFGVTKNTIKKNRTKEKKSFQRTVNQRQKNQQVSTSHTQKQPPRVKANPKVVLSSSLRNSQHPKTALQQDYQEKIIQYKRRESERKVRIEEVRQNNLQAIERRAFIEREQQKQKEIAYSQQKRLYREKIALKKQQSQAERQRKQREVYLLQKKKKTQSENTKLKEVQPNKTPTRQFGGQRNTGAQPVSVTDHLAAKQKGISQWQRLATQGISVQKHNEKNTNNHPALSDPETLHLKTKPQLPQKISVKAQVHSSHRKDQNTTKQQLTQILTKKSNSFFENVPEFLDDSARLSSSNRKQNFLLRVISYTKKSFGKSQKGLSDTVSVAQPQQKKGFPFSLFPALLSSRFDTSTVRYDSFRFASFGLICLTTFGTLMFMGHALATKDRVQDSADAAIEKLQGAANFARTGDFQKAYEGIENAHELFLQADEQISTINKAVVGVSHYIPGVSRLSSGDALVSASVHISHALAETTKLTKELDQFQEIATKGGLNDFSVLDVSASFFRHIKVVSEQLNIAKQHIDRVHIDDVPDGQRDLFIQLARTIDPLTGLLKQTVELEDSISELLGSEGTRKYLFIFQNNQEMRASGGFIGSYGFLDMNSGRIREFKIDGIYNPGGQLTDKVVPPRPIQKISAAWSLHDSNWWPDFPKSAEKAMDFYARTGGPSVDGVIAVTPVMVEQLLEITGPITLPQYNLTLTADNFVEMTRQEIEGNVEQYEALEMDEDEDDIEEKFLEDQELVKNPKKILSDLMPLLMGELKKDLSKERAAQLLNVVLTGLNERQVMIYMRNQEVREVIEKKKWGGRILSTEDDYLSVVHSNINGFKTDGVIDDLITHESRLSKDGRITNRVSIQRTHNGGSTGREWWDAVNANYMRVYVPEGSRLLSATGHTPEWHEPRLDYEALGFEVDADVAAEESSVYVDPESGTRVYSDSGKTVFGNWVYVSPGEKVTVTYEYELPWRFTTRKDESGSFSSYDILYQKQAGVQNSRLKSTILLDNDMPIISRIPDRMANGQVSNNTNEFEKEFNNDLYQGIVFRIQ